MTSGESRLATLEAGAPRLNWQRNDRRAMASASRMWGVGQSSLVGEPQASWRRSARDVATRGHVAGLLHRRDGGLRGRITDGWRLHGCCREGRHIFRDHGWIERGHFGVGQTVPGLVLAEQR